MTSQLDFASFGPDNPTSDDDAVDSKIVGVSPKYYQSTATVIYIYKRGLQRCKVNGGRDRRGPNFLTVHLLLLVGFLPVHTTSPSAVQLRSRLKFQIFGKSNHTFWAEANKSTIRQKTTSFNKVNTGE
jgi:hypothetical protein